MGELDKKMWTVLSCPVNGLEISSDSLSLMDQDGDGQLRLKEVVATADWLCATLKDPQSLFEQSDSILLDNIIDESIVAVARKIVESLKLKVERISLADVQAAIDAIAIETPEMPAAPFEADVIAAYKAKSPEYAAYFEQEKLQKIGLALIPEDAPKPGMTRTGKRLRLRRRRRMQMRWLRRRQSLNRCVSCCCSIVISIACCVTS